MAKKRNIIVGQSGGPTSVINSSLAGVYKNAIERGFDKVYGMLHGIQGLLDEQYIDLSTQIHSELDIELLKRTPSAFLGSCRFKLPEIHEDKAIYEKIFEILNRLDIDAFIPERYIKNEFQKLDVYKRIATIESEEEYDDMLEELMDRFGEPPKAVQNLLAVANLKAMAHRAWLTEIAQKGDQIRFTMFERAKADPAGIELLVKESKGKMKFVIDTNPYFIYVKPRKNGKDNEDVLTLVRSLTEKMIKNLACDV